MATDPAKKNAMRAKYLARRTVIWPKLNPDLLWNRKKRDGYTTIPRTLPIIGRILDELSKNAPIGNTYLELWCRAHDEYVVDLKNPDELAFHSGFTGERAATTWRARMKKLADLGFIDIQPGASSEFGFALIYDPYQVIRAMRTTTPNAISLRSYNALAARCAEIGEIGVL